MGDSFTRLPIHMTFATALREPSIPTDILPRLHAYIAGILHELNCPPLIVGGIEDHVHALFELAPTRSVSEVARIIKANSSKWLHEDVGVKDASWQRGYAAFAVSPTAVDDVRRYIANQREHHRSRSSLDEVLEMLNRAGVEHERCYVE